MTPKEKADDLIDKFLPHTKVYHEATGWEDYFDSAKECALIAVDEILEELPEGSIDYGISSRRRYWEEVKEELEKL
jgi:hypothetical protein